MKKLIILVAIVLSISVSKGKNNNSEYVSFLPQYKSCVKNITTNEWGTGVIRRCCCGCELMYMVGWNGDGQCST